MQLAWVRCSSMRARGLLPAALRCQQPSQTWCCGSHCVRLHQPPMQRQRQQCVGPRPRAGQAHKQADLPEPLINEELHGDLGDIPQQRRQQPVVEALPALRPHNHLSPLQGTRHSQVQQALQQPGNQHGSQHHTMHAPEEQLCPTLLSPDSSDGGMPKHGVLLTGRGSGCIPPASSWG